jgi:glycosyltransferase involved in cell wall biosynthesis
MSHSDQNAPARALNISAIVPNYNHAAFLPAAIAALQAQTLPPDEIIVIDDGSTDDSIAIIKQICAADERVRLIAHAENKGAIAAINAGITAAQGKYLLMSAADDVTSPQLLEKLHAALVIFPGAMLTSGEVVLTNEHGKFIGYRPPARPSRTIRHFTPDETWALFKRIDNFIITGASLFDRQALIDIGLLREELGSFADGFASRQLALRHGFVFVPETLGEWRINPNGLSRRTATDLDSAVKMLRISVENFASDPIFPTDYISLFTRRWRFAVLRLAMEKPTEASAMLTEFAPGPAILRNLFASLSRTGKIGRISALAWATLWYRPTSLAMVALTSLTRRRAKQN